MEEFIRDVGALTQDEQLVRGALALAGAATAALLGGWRLVRGKQKAPQRCKIGRAHV